METPVTTDNYKAYLNNYILFRVLRSIKIFEFSKKRYKILKNLPYVLLFFISYNNKLIKIANPATPITEKIVVIKIFKNDLGVLPYTLPVLPLT